MSQNMNLKILLSAYACEPDKGSEPEIGWKWATTLSKLGHETYVITRKNNKDRIENYLNKNNLTNLNFVYFDYSTWLIKIFKGKSNPSAYIYYFLWQIGIFFVAKSLLKKKKFDYIHHVTFGTLRYPSLLCLLKIPFIFGPIGGGEQTPKKLKKNFPLIFKIKEFLREINNYYVKISPLMSMTFSKSYKIFVTTEESKKLIPLKYHNKTEVLLPIGTDNLSNENIKLNKNRTNFNIIFAGVLQPRKGVSILLQTFSLIKKTNKEVILNIVGSGPMLDSMKKESIRMNIHSSINWLGHIDREKLINLFHSGDILFAPFLREAGGLVILEAMSTGLPVVTLNKGGPGEIVDNDCGIKIDINQKTENEIISELSNSINDLIINNDKLYYKRTKSLERVKKFSWKNKVLKIYGS